MPWLGPDTIKKVKLSPSTSLPDRAIVLALSSFVLTLWLPAAGASLTGSIVMLTVAGAESEKPSLALKVKLSGPL